MRALLIPAVCSLLLTASTATASAARAESQTAGKTCSGYVYSKDEPVGVTIARGSTTCSTAKRIIKTYLNSDAKCGGSSCLRKHSGWTCQTASADVYPRVASCVRGKARIEAYAIVD